MKKTSLLSLLTAGAIVATSAGTYAVWDTLEATQKTGGTVTIKAGSKLTISDTLEGFTVLNEHTNSSSASFEVETSNVPTDKNKIKFTLVNDAGDPFTSDNNVTYVIKDELDNEVSAGGVTAPTVKTKYKVVATLNDIENSPVADVNETVKVKVEFVE